MPFDYTGRPFPETRTSLIDLGRAGDAKALEELAHKYWPAIFAAISHAGWRDQRGESAEDLAQEVTATICLPANLVSWSAEKGRFRSWVCGLVRHFIADRLRKAGTTKRGGRAAQVPLDALSDLPDGSPAVDEVFDRKWAEINLSAAKAAVRAQWAAKGKEQLFDLLIVSAMLGSAAPETHEVIANNTGLTRGAVGARVSRLFDQIRDAFEAECRQTCGSDEEARAEMRHLAGQLRNKSASRNPEAKAPATPITGDGIDES